MQVSYAVSCDPAAIVYEGIEVTPHELPDRAKYRLPSMQAKIARASNRAPSAILPKYEDDVIKLVLRFYAEKQRRIPVLLEDDRRHQGGFQTMSSIETNDLPKGSERLPLALPIVRQASQVVLDLGRRAMGLDDLPFFVGEGLLTWRVLHLRSRSSKPASEGGSALGRGRLVSDETAYEIRQEVFLAGG